MKGIKKSLELFYDNQSEKFHNTRKKQRPEFHYIKNIINKNSKKSIKILELGCGDGRLFNFLKENSSKKIQYTGVDISKKLLKIAKKNNPDGYFFHQDMYSYLKGKTKEEFDYIIAIASFQHIPQRKERIEIIKKSYGVLQYDGSLIIVNWSYSLWFIKKYRKQIIKSILSPIYKNNDIFIPRKTSGNKQFKRYYHIFTKTELKKLLIKTSFKNFEIFYISNKGLATKNRKYARNTMTIGKKSILKH